MNSIDSITLELLRCPVTKSNLVPASAATLQWINLEIGKSACFDGTGTTVCRPIDDALVNADRTLAMPIRSGVVSLSSNIAICIKNIPQDLE